MCSTAKVMVVADMLKHSMSDKGLLQRRITYNNHTLLASGYAPVTQKHLQTGMTIEQLGRATISYSDNAAANLLMQQIGGPKAVTAFARTIGDNDFRLDRWEPALNSAIPGDARDTTTPKAMANSLQKLVLKHVLAVKQRRLLHTWLVDNTAGGA